MKPDQQTRLRLGSFELDLRTGELSPLEPDSRGRKILLQEQPFRVLQILIERGGEIATREEIKRKLWPNDTIVDFDHSINVAIGTLRRALGDSASQPKYIETVARRGYRLMVSPEWFEATDDPSDDGTGDAPGSQPAAGGLIGKKVSHFRVLEVIGGGGMGMVYKAEDLKLGRRVALKFLPEEMATDPLSLKRFEREAQTASSLNHPNICTIFEIEDHQGQPMIVMELLDGETLRDRLATSGSEKIPLDRLLEIAVETCNGLEAAHAKGIIHRDIKPANIFLTRDGSVKILDFGLAKIVEHEESGEEQPGDPDAPAGAPTEWNSSLTRTGATMGTASYMSPEQVRKEKLDARTDLFSFGLVLYEMATGQRAFPGDNASGVHEALLHQAPIPIRDLNPALPPALEAAIMKAIQKDRKNRYASAADMRRDLELIPTPARLRHRRIRKWFATAALVLIAAGAALAYWRYRSRYQLSSTDTIVIADLMNETSDAVLDDALNTALPVELSQTPFLQVLTQDKVRDTMQRLNHPRDAKITPAIAREVCLKTNSKAVVTSSIADAGNSFHLLLTGINCQSGKTFAQSEQDVTLRNGIVHALGEAGLQLRGRMGEPEESLRKFGKPLELATSSSPEALQLLARAFRQHRSPTDRAATLSMYERAIDIDPSFALAYASVGTLYLADGNTTQAIAKEKKAYELRDRLTGQLKFLAETLYYAIGTGDLEQAFPVYQEWVKTFPLDGVAHNNFALELYFLARYDQAAAEAREAIRLMPMQGVGSYWPLMASTAYANRLDEAKVIFAQAQAKKVDSPEMHDLRHMIAFLQHDESAMREELTWLGGRKAGAARQREGEVQAFYGHFDAARRLLRHQFEDSAENAASPFLLPAFVLDLGLQEAEVGNTTAAQRLGKDSTQLRKNRGAEVDLALLLARSGQIEQAEKLAEKINRESPQDTLVQYYQLRTIRAAIKLHQKDPVTAIKILRPAGKYDLAYPDSFNSVYPAYIRGLAYLRLNQGRQAAVEFQKLLDHPAIVGRHVTGALAHLQIGRAWAMMGDNAAARKSYQDFLTLWKDADPDLPIFREAQAEFAKLP